MLRPSGADVDVPALLATSIVLLVLFVLWSRYLENHTDRPPVMKMSLFSRRHGLVSIICITSTCQSTAVSSWVYTTTIFYQKYKGQSPFQNSISILTTTIMGVVAAVSLTIGHS